MIWLSQEQRNKERGERSSQGDIVRSNPFDYGKSLEDFQHLLGLLGHVLNHEPKVSQYL